MLQIAPLLLLFYTGLSIYIYTPAMPHLASAFETSNFAIIVSMAIFMGFYGFFQSIWITLSSSISGKVALVICILLSTLGIATTMLSNTLFIFTLGRVIEAIGISGTIIFIRSNISINFSDEKHEKFISLVVSIIFIAAFLGPILGAHLFINYGWRYIFAVLLIIILCINTILTIGYFKAKTQHVLKTTFRKANKDFYRLFSIKQLMGFVLPCVFSLAGCYSYFVVTPYIFMINMDYKITSYVYLNVVLALIFILGSLFHKILTSIWSHYKSTVTGLAILLISTATFIYFNHIDDYNTLSILLPMSLYMFASGIIVPSGFSKAKQESKFHSAEASAFVPYLLFAVSAIGTWILANFSIFSLLNLSIYFSSICALSIFFFFILTKPDSMSGNQDLPENKP